MNNHTLTDAHDVDLDFTTMALQGVLYSVVDSESCSPATFESMFIRYCADIQRIADDTGEILSSSQVFFSWDVMGEKATLLSDNDTNYHYVAASGQNYQGVEAIIANIVDTVQASESVEGFWLSI